MFYANYGTCELAPVQQELNTDAVKLLDLLHLNLDEQPLRSERLFGGLLQDIRRKLLWFPSDFGDFFRGRLSISMVSTLLLFFANLSNIITFSAVMEHSLDHQMASIENIICGAISGIIFGLISGQPLSILSATGPTLIFEKILFDLCIANQWEFLPFRFYVGLWMALFLLLLVATDAMALVACITRFTEEVFATLVSAIFILQAFEKLYKIAYEAPAGQSPSEQILPLVCLFLSVGTFLIAYSLNRLRSSNYFSLRIRNLLSDFGVLIAIVSLTLISNFFKWNVPSLKMPTSIRPTMDRNWLVDFDNIENPKVAFIAAIPAMFYTILVVMDQQITAVIVNRKDNKLKKGCGYHLDMLVIAILVLICSFLGLPFYVASTVLSVMHVQSLKQYAGYSMPGQPSMFLGVKEQRLTAIFAHILIGCSVFLTPIIKIVPVPVLIGIFFYMGFTSLWDQQFVQRIGLLFMPAKYQPDYVWLQSVSIKRVHFFTCIQLFIIVSLLAMKYSSSILCMIFLPMMLLFTVFVRMSFLERIFTQNELKALDEELPSFIDIIRPPSKHPLENEFKEQHQLRKMDEECAF